jgi:hypothetical protein
MRGFRCSLRARLRAAERKLERMPTNYEAQLQRMKALHALELLTSYSREDELHG